MNINKQRSPLQATDTEPGFAIWLTGLPASGKTTLGLALRPRLPAYGRPVQLLDSDELRRTLTPNPTYSPAERDWFYDVLVFLAELLTRNGVNVLIAATATRRAYRNAARERLARFAEVFVDTPPDVCRERDPKGLWARADAGEISGLPGVDEPYERPARPEVWVDTGRLSIEEAAEQVMAELERQGFF